MKIKGVTVPDRAIAAFWSHVEKTEGCWNWTAAKGKKGYGVLGFLLDEVNYTFLASRFSYALHFEDAADLCVLHRCDNPGCVRPDHLFLGTRNDNNQDMTRKGRHGSKMNREQWMKNRPRGEKVATSKLTWDIVRNIRSDFKIGVSQTVLSVKYKISLSQINNIVHHRQWIETTR